jgi:polyisoprenoid-binding protein YceI
MVFVLTVLFGMGIGQSSAKEIFTLGLHETRIDGSIPYAVIGQYKAQFGVFRGWIALDENLQQIQSVYLEIQPDSIKSNCPWCDKIARSRRLLNTARYPKIIFKSEKIIYNEKGYKVIGVLEMHGIKRRMTFPFQAGTIIDQRTKRKLLDIKGNWRINRKHFNIIWSRRLDRGGAVVSDYFTVHWRIKLYINP